MNFYLDIQGFRCNISKFLGLHCNEKKIKCKDKMCLRKINITIMFRPLKSSKQHNVSIFLKFKKLTLIFRVCAIVYQKIFKIIFNLVNFCFRNFFYGEHDPGVYFQFWRPRFMGYFSPQTKKVKMTSLISKRAILNRPEKWRSHFFIFLFLVLIPQHIYFSKALMHTRTFKIGMEPTNGSASRHDWHN